MSNLDAPDWLGTNPVGVGLIASLGPATIPAGSFLTTAAFPCVGFESLIVQAQSDPVKPLGFTLQYGWRALPFAPSSLPYTWFKAAGGPDTWFPSPVQGPRVQLMVTNPGAGTATLNGGIFGVPVGRAQDAIPPALLVDQHNVAFGGTSSLFFSPTVCVPGRVQAWMTGGNGMRLGIEVWNGTAFHIVNQVDVATGALNLSQEFIVPADDWEIVATNVNAAATISVAVNGPA